MFSYSALSQRKQALWLAQAAPRQQTSTKWQPRVLEDSWLRYIAQGQGAPCRLSGSSLTRAHVQIPLKRSVPALALESGITLNQRIIGLLSHHRDRFQVVLELRPPHSHEIRETIKTSVDKQKILSGLSSTEKKCGRRKCAQISAPTRRQGE